MEAWLRGGSWNRGELPEHDVTCLKIWKEPPRQTEDQNRRKSKCHCAFQENALSTRALMEGTNVIDQCQATGDGR